MAGLDPTICAKYFRLNPDKLGPVTRYGSGTFLASSRDPKTGALTHYPERVVPITHKEWAKFRAEYKECLKSKHLLECSREDYEKSLEASEKAEQERAAEYAKNKAEKAAAANAPTPSRRRKAKD